MTDKDRRLEELTKDRDAVETRMAELEVELGALRRERQRLHDAIGQLIGVPALSRRGRPADAREAAERMRTPGCTCKYHDTCATLAVCAACLRCALCAGHSEGCLGCPASLLGECPDGQLPDGPTCPRCGGERAPYVEGGRWLHWPGKGETL